MSVDYRVGDVRDVMATIPDGSVDCVLSSPPFLALRSYLPAGHESKHAEIGSERNPAEFIDMLLGLTAEWGRVLAAHGSIAIELGDTYSGSGGAGGDYNEGGLRDGQTKFRQSGWHRSGNEDTDRYRSLGAAYTAPNGGTGWPRAKSLALIPQLYAVALAYGVNPLTGQPSPAGRWLVRNVVVWHRPNPAVGALGDKVRPSTSYIVIATRSPKRWFDLTAVRGDVKQDYKPHNADMIKREAIVGDNGFGHMTQVIASNPAGAPPLDAWFDQYDGTHDTWTLTTQPSSICHYAMWPAKLAERLILMMCPAQVCRICGEPRRRIETVSYEGTTTRLGSSKASMSVLNGVSQGHHAHRETNPLRTVTAEHWTDCNCHSAAGAANRNAPRPDAKPTVTPPPDQRKGHGYTSVSVEGSSPSGGATSNFRPGLVLDPFCGSGTTCAVADLHGRDAIGVDIDARNAAIYPRRYDEVKRALYGSPIPDPDQLELAL